MAGSKVNGNLAVSQRIPNVITIEARERPQTQKLRVAAYARVSSDSADQLNSFMAQNRYYTTLIGGKDDWELVDVYADEGITGTSAQKREDFQRLLLDCHKGRVDKVLTKSVSRFARNTKDCLEIIRELKALGIGVFFEEQNIDTAKMSGELLTAIFAGLAQAESESISGNMRWSYQRRMQNGTFITCTAPYGYRLLEGRLEVYEPEAEIVRVIFERYLDGDSTTTIAHLLDTLGVKTRFGAPSWHRRTIQYILSNEKYIGDALLQKRFTTDTLPYKKIINRGQLPQYYIADSHTPIISEAKFRRANQLLKARSERADAMQNEASPLALRLFCGNCGHSFKCRKKRKKVYWVCRKHDSGKTLCDQSGISEGQIHSAFLRLYYKLKHHGGSILEEMVNNLQTIRRRRMLWSLDVVALNKRISELTSQNQILAELKQQGLVDPDFFISQTNQLAEQLRSAKLEKERYMDTAGDDTIARTRELMEILDAAPDVLSEFDGELFVELVDRIIVESNDWLRFRLKNGLELREPL